MSFVPLNQGANLAPRERLIPLAAASSRNAGGGSSSLPVSSADGKAAAAATTSILGKGQRAEQPSEKLAALAKKRGI